MRPLRTVALLGRSTGLAVLEDALIGNPQIELDAVYTHGRLPKSEGGGERRELAAYKELCAQNDIPLHVLDLPEARAVEAFLPAGNIDLMIVLSWKYILSREALERVSGCGVNLHRGALPAYPGLNPVRRAIEAGERRVAITAHRLVEEVDAGPILATVWLDIDPLRPGRDPDDYAQEVKARLGPLYAPLARLAITLAAS